ncbi:nexilin-like [Condylostylus longicornis]|uniref:nexilin-like n=1 Tax=Condylostylus longicornis TaxID=2530218 RepID=UPI00244DF255|nr:nexilin-like [Condylostylus longicornis]
MIDEEDVKGSYNEVLREKLLQDPLNYEKDSRVNLEKNLINTSNLKNSAHQKNEECVYSNEGVSMKLRKSNDKMKTDSQNTTDDNKENCVENLTKSNNFEVKSQISKKELSEKKLPEPTETDAKNFELKKNSPNMKINPPTNLLQHPIKSWSGSSVQNKEKIPVPNVIKYVEIYEKKRQDYLKKQKEEDRKNRIFHSKPAPNFALVRENSKKQYIEKKITEPITPRVLKNSFKASEKLKKLENIKQKSPKKYHAREARVLNESPFVPKKETHVLETQPFKLHIEKRLCERKYFDEKIHRLMEEKKKKEEEERIKRDEELSKEFRKMTTFKARPNPFK